MKKSKLYLRRRRCRTRISLMAALRGSARPDLCVCVVCARACMYVCVFVCVYNKTHTHLSEEIATSSCEIMCVMHMHMHILFRFLKKNDQKKDLHNRQPRVRLPSTLEAQDVCVCLCVCVGVRVCVCVCVCVRTC